MLVLERCDVQIVICELANTTCRRGQSTTAVTECTTANTADPGAKASAVAGAGAIAAHQAALSVASAAADDANILLADRERLHTNLPSCTRLTSKVLTAETAAAALLIRSYVAAVDVGCPARVVAAASQKVRLMQIAVLAAAPHAAKWPNQQTTACRPPYLHTTGCRRQVEAP